MQSWWVLYEIGYGKNASKKLSTLTLKNTVTIPAYLDITRLIRRTRSLNDYIKEISHSHYILLESINFFINQNQYSKLNHALDNVLNWQK